MGLPALTVPASAPPHRVARYPTPTGQFLVGVGHLVAFFGCLCPSRQEILFSRLRAGQLAEPVIPFEAERSRERMAQPVGQPLQGDSPRAWPNAGFQRTSPQTARLAIGLRAHDHSPQNSSTTPPWWAEGLRARHPMESGPDSGNGNRARCLHLGVSERFRTSAAQRTHHRLGELIERRRQHGKNSARAGAGAWKASRRATIPQSTRKTT